MPDHQGQNDGRRAMYRLVHTLIAGHDGNAPNVMIVGSSGGATRLERDAIPNLPVVSGARTKALFAEADLAKPFEVFRILWCRYCVKFRQPDTIAAKTTKRFGDPEKFSRRTRNFRRSR